MLNGHPTPKSVGNGLINAYTHILLFGCFGYFMWDIFSHNECYKNLKKDEFRSCINN